MTPETVLADVPLIDTDSHVSEPPDLWTSRMPSKFAEMAPRPVWVEAANEMRWKVGDVLLDGVARFALAGFDEFPPAYPRSLEEADPASYDAKKRLERLDEYGLYAQVLYPNVIAFSAPQFLTLGADFATASVRAWNDFLAEWAEADPNRLLPMMMLPFWDVDACVKEIGRAKEIGHKGIVLGAHMERGGFPPLWDHHWDPLFATAQDADLSINFHVAFNLQDDELDNHWQSSMEDIVVATGQYMLGNAKAVADVACRGVCHRFPDLKFVSVESGIGWLPYLMENLDWHWKSFGGLHQNPERELPSYYIRRQVYGTYWFEGSGSVRESIEFIPDNVMFESDFPHNTSLSPGPASYAEQPRKMAVDSLAGADESLIRKVFYENAAAVYGLPPLPAR
jgi:predicted TIM-barrel fold metal-dependent hydrolase